jgi:hypothetical protein
MKVLEKLKKIYKGLEFTLCTPVNLDDKNIRLIVKLPDDRCIIFHQFNENLERQFKECKKYIDIELEILKEKENLRKVCGYTV